MIVLTRAAELEQAAAYHRQGSIGGARSSQVPVCLILVHDHLLCPSRRVLNPAMDAYASTSCTSAMRLDIVDTREYMQLHNMLTHAVVMRALRDAKAMQTKGYMHLSKRARFPTPQARSFPDEPTAAHRLPPLFFFLPSSLESPCSSLLLSSATRAISKSTELGPWRTHPSWP